MHPIEEAFSRRGLPVASLPFPATPLKPLDGAKTVFITALPYYYPLKEEQNLARFAALPDYHAYFGTLLAEIAEELKATYPGFFFKGFTDNSPIDERAAAVESGLGVRGKNNLCITKYGSFVFLGEIVTDLEISLESHPFYHQCGSCNRCVQACPNGALTAEGFHPERCLAYVTQKKGELTEEEAAALKKNRLAWGCDRCAEACPANQGLPTAPIALPPNVILPRLTAAEVSPLSDRQFREKYSKRAFAWRGKATMLRNLNILEGENS